jgi:hypothetical protein
MKYHDRRLSAFSVCLKTGASVDVMGGGTIDFKDGITVGAFTLADEVDRLAPYVLALGVGCGFPAGSVSLDQSSNPFWGKNYRYTRHLRFKSGEGIRLQAACTAGEVLSSLIHIDGTMPALTVFPLEPVVESWRAAGPGRIHSTSSLAWKRLHSYMLSASAETDYEFESDGVEINPLDRFVRTDLILDGTVLRMRQTSRLRRSLLC